MNYRHAFHAGNFADVVKHAILCRLLTHLIAKEKPFRVIDTHAGRGLYDLAGEAASRTQEWRGGIGRLLEQPLSGEAARLLEPYLTCVRPENKTGALNHYPGSPLIARAFCRDNDRMIFCEHHPEDFAALRQSIGEDRRATAMDIDGWTALKAHLPPKERRGLVLVDPPFEEPNEFERMRDGLEEGISRWPTGIFLLWYPVKNEHEVRQFERRLARLKIPKILCIEFAIDKPRAEGPLVACGLIVVNPPWMLEEELKIILPALAAHLGRNRSGRYSLGQLVSER